MNFLAVALGGALGAILRYLISLKFTDKTWFLLGENILKNFPLATFLANFLGSFLLGIFFVLFVEKQLLPENWRLFFILGFTGSLTTFSTFSLENLQLLQKAYYFVALTNIAVSLIITLIAVWVAILLTRALL